MGFEIKLAYDDIDNVKILFNEYAEVLDENLKFQNYDDEVKTLPGKYDIPDGRLYLAYCEGVPAGCIALRHFDEKTCEMKRLFVRPEFRGKKIGEMLANKIISDAVDLKYEAIILDTLVKLKSAVKLYRKLGFSEIEQYYENPMKNALYFKMYL